MRFLSSRRLKYAVLGATLIAAIVLLWWGHQNAVLSVPEKDPTFLEQAAMKRFKQAMVVAIAGGMLFIGLLIRDYCVVKRSDT